MSQPTPQKNGVLWIDIETTGLIPGKDLILEVAYIFTDMYGTFLEARSRLVELQPEDQDQFFQFATGDSYAFVRGMHTKNGLIQDFYDPGAIRFTLEEIVAEMWNLQEVLEMDTDITFWYLGGSSVHTDRAHFEARGLELPVSHRHLDVSSLKLFAEATNQPFYKKEPGDRAHRALTDIREDLNNYVEFVERNTQE